MGIRDKANLILSEIEYYFQFDNMQRKYAEKEVIKALKKDVCGKWCLIIDTFIH
ncbi:hypothetical protein P7D63_20325 [Enterococcus raffinosus]|uniref:hypothetical protein n=1 Tax=Enterococcus raffinosus TaxID=71452 RepID=UPI00288F584A|nr:hypothetical protein [Enterococcus raffinosus]MDT2557033.1 hypothetical protein [Enterococcus raffinosus]